MRKYLLALLLTLFVALPAFAADDSGRSTSSLPSFSDVKNSILNSPAPSGDPIQKFVGQLFGITGDKLDAGSLPKIIGTFNIICCAMFAIVLGYMAMIFTVDVGRKGEVDGAAGIDAIWTPLRMAFGLAMMIPLGSTGFSGAQYLYGYTTYYGIAGGNYLWQQAAALTLRDGTPPVAEPSPMAPGFVGGVLKIHICAAYHAARYAESFPDDKTPPFTNKWEMKGNAKAVYTVELKPEKGLNLLATMYGGINCGTVEVDGSENYSLLQKAAAALPWAEPLAPDSPTFRAHFGAAQGVIERSIPIAVNVVKMIDAKKEPAPGWSDEKILNYIRDYVKAESSNYTKSVVTFADIENRKATDRGLVARVASAGWANAGSFWMEYARRANATAAILNMVPAITAPSVSGTFFNKSREQIDQTNEVVARMTEQAVIEQIGVGNSEVTKGKSSTTGGMGFVGNAMTNTLRSWFDPAVASSSVGTVLAGNPIQKFVDLGQSLLTTAYVLQSAKVALDMIPLPVSDGGKSSSAGWFSKAAGKATAIPFAGAALKIGGAVKEGIDWILPYLWAVGALLAYVLPLLPAVMWMAGVVVTLLLLLEALLAAPLWSIAHARAGGSPGMFGEALHGYQVLFQLMMRPSLMVMGMVAGMTFYTISSHLVSTSIYTYAIDGAMRGHTVGPVGWVTFTMVVVIVQFFLAYHCFNIVFTLPDTVMSWLGIREAGHRDALENIQRLTSVMSAGGLQSIAGGAQQAMKQGAHAGAAKHDALKKAAKDAKNKNANGPIQAQTTGGPSIN